MQSTLIDQVHEAILGKKAWSGLAFESPLRVAATMLCRASEHETQATRVVGTVGPDDVEALHALVTEIVEECGLGAEINIRGESFAVRFSRA